MQHLRRALTLVATKQLRYGFTVVRPDKQVDLEFTKLTDTFLKSRDMSVFSKLIKESNNVIDNLYYFKIYKFLVEAKGQIRHLEDFYQQVNSTVTKKSDNLRMLLASCKTQIAKIHEQCQNYYDSIKCLEEAMEVLEQSLIPPVLQYYQIYRYYGFLQYTVNNKKEAEEALLQAVTTIDKFIEQSDDYVQNNGNSKNQAKAYCLLASMNTEGKREEWIKKAFECWEQFEGNKYELREYADSILEKAQLQAEKDKEKAEELLTVSIYQFKDQSLKEYLKQRKAQILGKQ